MYSSAQIVLLFDVNCLDLSLQPVNDFNVHIATFKLCCLRLLTEFGAQTQNGSDVRWATKFYDSLIFKPGKSNNSFLDFNRRNYDNFDLEISKKLKISSNNSKNGESANSPKQRKTRQNNSMNHTACFILNKAIQEALKDYNWDLPDVSSPVNTRYQKNQQDNKNNGNFNAIVVFTKFPQDIQGATNFIGNSSSKNPHEIAKQFIEKATVKALEEAQSFRLYFIETCTDILNLKDIPILESLNSVLGHFNGSLLSISSIVDCSGLIFKSPRHQNLPSQKLHLRGLENAWFSKGRHNRSGRLRKPQPGPTLVWQKDALPIEKFTLEVLVLQGRVSHEWQEMSVVGSAKASSAAHTAMASHNSQIMLCRQQQPVETPSNQVAFDDVLIALQQFNLVLVLQLTCGGLGLLSPFLGSVGCLTVLSSSGLAQPPLSRHEVEDSLLALATKPLLNFTQAAIKKALHVGGGVQESGALASSESSAPQSNSDAPAFKQAMLEPWYCCNALPKQGVALARRNVLSRTQLSILNRAQRRCCPQLSRLACPPDASKIAPGSGKTAPGHHGTAGAMVLAAKHSSAQGRPGVSEGSFSKPAKTVSRALQLVNKSKIVTAQQKVKEQRNEEEEQEVARERRAQQSNLRSQKSQAIMSSTLSNIQDTSDAATVIQSLINLRDSVSGKSTTDRDSHESADVFGVAQTIINLALMHVRSSNETATSSATTDAASCTSAKGGIELREVLSEVMLSSRDISALPKECQLPQYQLHTLLHLETMWLMGYSSNTEGTADGVTPEQERRNAEREAHLEEILKLLRGITLHFNPSFTTSFLNQTVLTNYEDTLPDVLTEVFEELNQPLPPSLAGPLSVNTTLDTPPLQQLASIQSSIHSAGSLVASGGNTRGGVRRRNSNMAVMGGGGGRQVVVPGSRMARLTRATSEQQAHQGQDKKVGGKSSVRRSLFDNRGSGGNRASNPSQGAAVTPQRPKRRRGSAKSGDSPHRAAKRLKVMRTPREERKRRRSVLRSDEDYGHLRPDELFTPNKRDQLASPLTPANRRLLSASKGGVLAPGTPTHLLGRSMTSLRRSAGSAVVAESPEVKGKSLLTGRRSATGRSSFYSGAQSRNCERARTSLLVQRLQSNCSDKLLNSSNSSGTAQASHSNNANVSASSFLFSKICASAPPEGAVSRVAPKVDRRRSMRRALNFDNVDDVQSKPASEISPAIKRLARSNAKERSSPIKNVTRALSLGTPTKEFNNRPPLNDCQKSAERKSPCTPKRLLSDNDRALALGSPGNLTPSKRVQFSLEYTPSKANAEIHGNATPKSILKTPTRTPLRQTTSRTPRLCMTPSSRPILQFVRTPRSGLAFSPDLFSCGKSGVSAFSPAKTPSKSPVKFVGLTPNKHRRSSADKYPPLFSPIKKLSRSPKKIRDRFSSPVKSSSSSGRRGFTGKMATAKTQETVVLNHGLDICDKDFQGIEEAPLLPSDAGGLSNFDAKNDSLPDDASVQVASSDSAIFVDKISSSPTTEDRTQSTDETEEEIKPSKVYLSNTPCHTLVSNSVQSASTSDKFFEIFDGVTEENILQDHYSPCSMDEIFMNIVTNNEAVNYPLDTVPHNEPLSEINSMTSVNFASDIVNETCSKVCDKLACDPNYVAPPLLDIPAMLSSKQESIKINPAWVETEDFDSSFSSPEIEITPTDRDSVKKCLLQRKKKDVSLGLSFEPNEPTTVEGTKASQTVENKFSVHEENSAENRICQSSALEFPADSFEVLPDAIEVTPVSELENVSCLTSALHSTKTYPINSETQNVLLPYEHGSHVSNDEISADQKLRCMSEEEKVEKDDGEISESSVCKTLKSDVHKKDDSCANRRSRLKRFSSSSLSSQKSISKEEIIRKETPNKKDASVEVDRDVEEETCSSPVIKSRSKKRNFNSRCGSSDAGCLFTVTDHEGERVEQDEESQLHSMVERLRKPSRVRNNASSLLTCESRLLPPRKSSNVIPNYCEDSNFAEDDEGELVTTLSRFENESNDFAEDDEGELVTTLSRFENESKIDCASSVSETNSHQERKRKRESSKESNEEGKSSTKTNEPEKENICIASGPNQRPTRCSKRRIDWSDFKGDMVNEESSVDSESEQIRKSPSSRTRYPRRSNDKLHSSRISASSGSVFSPEGLQYDQSLGITPLQNVDNFTQGRRPLRDRMATSYADFPSDDSELFAESSHNNTPLDDTCVPVISNNSQVKIDKYLSPVRRPSGFEPPVVREADTSSTPSSSRIDWKQTKPVRTREKLLDRSIPKPFDEFQEPSVAATLTKNKKKKGKKKSVKLKFKKSGDEYQVSRPDLSGDSLNTTVSDCHSTSQVSCPESDEKKGKRNKSKSKKSGDGDSLLTPLRFTRHMSKDLSITPELFQKLVSASPNSKISKPCVSPRKSPKRPLPNIRKLPQESTMSNVAPLLAYTSVREDNVWRVESVQGSPTMKTFIRVGNSPSCSKSRLHLASPSLSSMLHLSTSPLVNKHKTLDREDKKSLTNENAAKAQVLTSRLDLAEHEVSEIIDENAASRELDQPTDRSKSKKRRFSSRNEDGPSLKRLRSRSPVKRVRARREKSYANDT